MAPTTGNIAQTDALVTPADPIVTASIQEKQAWAVNCLKIIPCQSAGNLRALASVQIGPLVIHGCRLIQQTNQAPWVSMPQRQDDAGRWFPIVATEDQELRDAVKGAVLQAWDAWRIFRVGGGEQ